MTSKPVKPDMFKSLEHPQKELPGIALSRYRIYTEPGKFILVEGENAQAAMLASGIKTPYRILRDTRSLHNVIDFETMTAETEAQVVYEEEAEATAALPDMPPDMPVEVAAQGLSAVEVDNLLKDQPAS